MTRHTAPKVSNTKLVFDYGHRNDYKTTMNVSYTKKQHIKFMKAAIPHITELAPFGIHHPNVKVGLTTARPNFHNRLSIAKGATPGNNLNTISHEKEAVPDIAQFEDKIVAPSTGSRLVHSKNVRSELEKHPTTNDTNRIVKSSKEEEDYADYIYPNDLTRYRLLQLESEEDEIHPKPPQEGSIKPKPFHGIRKLPRHTPKTTPFELAKPAPVQRTDYDIISHLPRPAIKAPAVKPPKLSHNRGELPFSTHVDGKTPHDFRRKITILLPGNEQHKRHGERTFMDE